MSTNWLAVASADHVRHGRQNGFMQLGHGKAAPLRRLAPADRIVYYSPTETFRGNDKLQAFTAIGLVKPKEPYQADMAEGFSPFRRDAKWLASREAPIAPLLDTLEFSAGVKNWGYRLRLGLFPVSDHDIKVIAAAMGAKLAA
jgi:EVE domain